MYSGMNNRSCPGEVFSEGEEVILAEGTYQGTRGIFVRLRTDPRWADIKQHNGLVREHPVEWLTHDRGIPASRSASATSDSSEATPLETVKPSQSRALA